MDTSAASGTSSPSQTASEPTRKRANLLLKRYYSNPALFAAEILGVTTWDRQTYILDMVAKHLRVAVKSGHKVGKSTSAAILALWFVCTRKRARVIMTSSSGRQVKSILWKELTRIYNTSKVPLGGILHKAPDSGLQFADGREVLGYSTDEPEKVAGVSSPELLYILDEASGIKEEIFEAIEGNRAGGARIVMFSNPTRTVGTFFDAFHSKRDFWFTISVSSAETPNVKSGRRLIPGLATKDWVDEKRAEWGEDSALYQVRVVGNFPSQSSTAVIPLYLVTQAVQDWDKELLEHAPDRLSIGVDVGREGDDETVIQPVRGLFAYEKIILQGKDSHEVAGEVLRIARALRRPGERPRVNVDVIGVGSGVYDCLKREKDVEAFGINVAETATAEGYALIRDQLWGALRDWLKDGGVFPPDSRLEAELVAPTYGFASRGRYKVQSKDEIRAVLKRSPDRADALGLAVYEPPPAAGFGGMPQVTLPKRRM